MITISDKKIRNIKLTGDELRLLIDGIKSNFPYSLYEWYKPVIKKLEKVLEKK